MIPQLRHSPRKPPSFCYIVRRLQHRSTVRGVFAQRIRLHSRTVTFCLRVLRTSVLTAEQTQDDGTYKGSRISRLLSVSLGEQREVTGSKSIPSWASTTMETNECFTAVARQIRLRSMHPLRGARGPVRYAVDRSGAKHMWHGMICMADNTQM
jgi:hypothetical protein